MGIWLCFAVRIKISKEVILLQNSVPKGEEVEEKDVEPLANSPSDQSDAQVESSVEDLRRWEKEATAAERAKIWSSKDASSSVQVPPWLELG